jgi:hypothetical protein
MHIPSVLVLFSLNFLHYLFLRLLTLILLFLFNLFSTSSPICLTINFSFYHDTLFPPAISTLLFFFSNVPIRTAVFSVRRKCVAITGESDEVRPSTLIRSFLQSSQRTALQWLSAQRAIYLRTGCEARQEGSQLAQGKARRLPSIFRDDDSSRARDIFELQVYC